jgi:hypothetical protein
MLTRSRLIALSAAVLSACFSLAVAAFAHGGGDHGSRGHGGHHGGDVLRANLIGSQPGDHAVHGVGPGGVPWVIDRGSVRLRSDGRLKLRVDGLVIPPPQGTNTAGGVTTITASLYCGDDTAAAAKSAAVPLTQSGDARIDEKLTIAGACVAPVVLVNPNGGATRFIAATGFGR